MYLLQPSPRNAPERALLQPGILYQDTRKEGPDGQHVPLTDADILESARKAWSQPFIVVDALGGDPERNGAIGRKLRRRRQ